MKKPKAKDATTEHDKQIKQAIKVQPNPNSSSFYAVRTQAKITKEEVCLEFMELVDADEKEATFKPVVRVWLALPHYKRVQKMIAKQVSEYEALNGPIPKGNET